MKLTKLTNNPIENIERAFDSFFNLTPVFHNLEEVYRTGDQVRFSVTDDGLTVQIDLPGVKREDLEISVDSSSIVYIKGKREVISHNGKFTQTYNRDFSVGNDCDIEKIKFDYKDGVLQVTVPKKNYKKGLKKYTV